ncbi:MAG: AMP-binding protein, partial [Alphaproteobacteria bacterium]
MTCVAGSGWPTHWILRSWSTKERVIDFFGEGRLYERYGCTETSIVTALRPADQLRKIQCVGQPLPATQVMILGEDGAELPRG